MAATAGLFNGHLLELSALVGTLFPLVAAFFKQSGFSRRANAIVCIVLAAIAGVITCLANNTFSLHDIIGSALAIYTVAVPFYQGLWQHLGEPTLTHVTSVVKATTEVADPANTLSPAPPNPLH
jgi:SNF family Na+-dependent transporter